MIKMETLTAVYSVLVGLFVKKKKIIVCVVVDTVYGLEIAAEESQSELQQMLVMASPDLWWPSSGVAVGSAGQKLTVV